MTTARLNELVRRNLAAARKIEREAIEGEIAELEVDLEAATERGDTLDVEALQGLIHDLEIELEEME